MSPAEMLRRIEELEAALKPFADEGVRWVKADPLDDSPFASKPDNHVIRVPFTVGDFRKAHSVLEET